MFKRGSYYYFWYYEGNTRRLKSTGKTTIAAARTAQQAFLRSLPSSGYFGSYVADWFRPGRCPWTRLRREAGASISDDYLENRRGYLENHVLPAFSDRVLSGISGREIESWLYSLELANQTRKHIYATLDDIFEYAVRQGDVAENPVKAVTAPVVSSKSSRDSFRPDEIQKLLVGARMISNKAFLAIWTLWASGIRSGELRALRASDVLHDPALWVRSAMKRKGVVGETKTVKGYRVVPIPKHLHSTLLRYRDKHLLLEDAFLFPVARETVSWWVRKSKDNVGIVRDGLVAHSLRHSYKSILHGSLPDSILRDVMGHASERSAERYDQRWVEQRLSQLRKYQDSFDGLSVSLTTGTQQQESKQ